MFLNGHASFSASLDVVRKHLRRGTHAGRTLISGEDDPSTIGGVRALEEAGRADKCAALGHGGSTEARAELRRARTPLIATVGYFPEKYGEALISMALQILNKRSVAPALFIKHQLITAGNVDHFYPTDALRSANEQTALSSSGGML